MQRSRDYKIRLRYTLPNGRSSERTCWRSQLVSAVERNRAKGITDTEWRRATAGTPWQRAPRTRQPRSRRAA